MPAVLDRLWRDHANISLVLKALERQLDRFREGEGEDFDIVLASLDYCRDFAERLHHAREDALLKKLRERKPETAEAVGDLEAEHRGLTSVTNRFGELLEQIIREEELSRDQFATVWQEFLDRYRQHMKMEEEALFVEAGRSLSAEDWRDVEAELSQRADPIFGDRIEDRFRSLKEDIDALRQEQS